MAKTLKQRVAEAGRRVDRAERAGDEDAMVNATVDLVMLLNKQYASGKKAPLKLMLWDSKKKKHVLKKSKHRG